MMDMYFLQEVRWRGQGTRILGIGEGDINCGDPEKEM